MPKPRVIDESDVIVKVTGSTICGSDLHLYHGMICSHHSPNTLWERRALLTRSVTGVIPELEKGDVLGHEFCGVVESVGPGIKNIKTGDRVVASFPIACGNCMNCKKGLTSACERTNSNSIANALYGKRTAG